MSELSFFRALNPISKKSGIKYSLVPYTPAQGQEMIDTLVSEQITHLMNEKDLGLGDVLGNVFHAIVGTHFDLYKEGSRDCKGGRKGLLDFLIFPLVARKLIADAYLPERENAYMTNILAFSLAMPLELMRLGAGVALTLALAPFIALIHLVKECLARDDEETGHAPVISGGA